MSTKNKIRNAIWRQNSPYSYPSEIASDSVFHTCIFIKGGQSFYSQKKTEAQRCDITSPLSYNEPLSVLPTSLWAGSQSLLVNNHLVEHVFLDRKSPNMCWVNAKFSVIKCLEECAHVSFEDRGGEVWIVWNYWQGFLKEVASEMESRY